MTREEAEKKIQDLLSKMQQIFDQEIRPLADEYQIEFSFMGSTMHYRDYYDYQHPGKKALAKTGFFAADTEWEGSSLGCYGDSNGFYAWRKNNWPEDFDGEDD